MKIHDGLSQVRREGLWIPQMPESPCQSDERILDEVLGSVAVAGEQVGKPECSGSVPDVELFQPRGLQLGFLGHLDARVHHPQY